MRWKAPWRALLTSSLLLAGCSDGGPAASRPGAGPDAVWSEAQKQRNALWDGVGAPLLSSKGGHFQLDVLRWAWIDKEGKPVLAAVATVKNVGSAPASAPVVEGEAHDEFGNAHTFAAGADSAGAKLAPGASSKLLVEIGRVLGEAKTVQLKLRSGGAPGEGVKPGDVIPEVQAVVAPPPRPAASAPAAAAPSSDDSDTAWSQAKKRRDALWAGAGEPVLTVKGPEFQLDVLRWTWFDRGGKPILVGAGIVKNTTDRRQLAAPVVSTESTDDAGESYEASSAADSAAAKLDPGETSLVLIEVGPVPASAKKVQVKLRSAAVGDSGKAGEALPETLVAVIPPEPPAAGEAKPSLKAPPPEKKEDSERSKKE